MFPISHGNDTSSQVGTGRLVLLGRLGLEVRGVLKLCDLTPPAPSLMLKIMTLHLWIEGHEVALIDSLGVAHSFRDHILKA